MPGGHPILSDAAVALVAARFQALADASRIRILNQLMQGERSVQDVVEATGLAQPNASRHLALLRKEGIVARRADGTRALYSIADPSVIALCDTVCSGLARRHRGNLEALPARGRRARRS